MAGKNQVTLTFAGDSSKLEQTFKNVGTAAKDMDTKVGEASDSFVRAGEAADNTYNSFDGLEAVGRGTTDTMSGLGNIMSGNVLQGSTDLAGGIAALASGFADALLPMLKRGIAAMKSMRVATLLSLGPYLLVGAAIAALAFLVIKNFDKIKGAIAAAFNWVKRNWPLLLAILTGPFGLAVRWIIRHWDGVVTFVKGLPKRITSAASGMWDGIKNAFRSAINTVIGWWNNLSFTLPKVHIPGTPFDVGGFTLSTPNIPTLHSGGVVPGAPGSETLAMLQAGERVTPAGAADRMVLELRGDGSQLGDALVALIAKTVRVRGGNVQLVLGGRA